jgi:hypothetical protein
MLEEYVPPNILVDAVTLWMAEQFWEEHPRGAEGAPATVLNLFKTLPHCGLIKYIIKKARKIIPLKGY